MEFNILRSSMQTPNTKYPQTPKQQQQQMRSKMAQSEAPEAPRLDPTKSANQQDWL